MAGRTTRSLEERVAEIDQKINFHKEKIAMLEEKKKNLLTPKISATQIIAAAKQKGMSIDDIIKRLGVDV